MSGYEHDPKTRARRHLARALALAATAVIGLGAAVAVAQSPGGAPVPDDPAGTLTTTTGTTTTDGPGATPTAPQTDTTTVPSEGPPLSVALDVGDGDAEQDDGFKFNFVITNPGASAVTGATLELTVEDRLDIETVSDTGSKTLTASGDRFRHYTLGPVAPNVPVRFDVTGDFEHARNRHDGDTLEVKVVVRTPGGQVSEDIEHIRFEGTGGD